MDQMQLPERLTQPFNKRWVLIAIIVLAVVLIVVDIYLARDEIDGNTWSELVRLAAIASPVVPWLAGLVMGHWFHPGEERDPIIEAPGNAVVLVVVSFLILALGFFVDLPPWIPFLVGAPVGAYVWPVATRPERPEMLGGGA